MNYKMTRAKGKSKILFNCSIVEWPDGYQVDADNFEMHFDREELNEMGTIMTDKKAIFMLNSGEVVTFTLIEGPEDL